MSKYRSREAPFEGSSVSEENPGFWADHIRHEDQIRQKWFQEYGHFYEKNLVGLNRDYDYNPISGHVPRLEPCKYLADGTVSESEPVAYLNACIRQSQHQGVFSDDKNVIPGKMLAKHPYQRWCLPCPGTRKDNITGPYFDHLRESRVPIPPVQDLMNHLEKNINSLKECEKIGYRRKIMGFNTRYADVLWPRNVCSGPFLDGYACQKEDMIPRCQPAEQLKIGDPCCSIDINMQPNMSARCDRVLKSCGEKGIPLHFHASYSLARSKIGRMGTDQHVHNCYKK